MIYDFFQGCLLRQLTLTMTAKTAYATREEKKGQSDSTSETLLLLDSQHKDLKCNQKAAKLLLLLTVITRGMIPATTAPCSALKTESLFL